MMPRWWRRLVSRADSYYDQDWRVVWFQPILYSFVFGAAIRLAIYPGDPPNFQGILGFDYYHIWLTIAVVSPLMALASVFFIRRGGRTRVWGMGTRLAADIGMFTTILAFHVTTILTNPPTESRIFARYVVAAAMLFVLELILRDGWAIRLNEKRAHRLRKHRVR